LAEKYAATSLSVCCESLSLVPKDAAWTHWTPSIWSFEPSEKGSSDSKVLASVPYCKAIQDAEKPSCHYPVRFPVLGCSNATP
jgi:hypothetical protein